MQSHFFASLLAAAVAILVCWLPSEAVAQDGTRTDGATSQNAAYWSDAWRGWHFYEEPDAEEVPQIGRAHV